MKQNLKLGLFGSVLLLVAISSVHASNVNLLRNNKNRQLPDQVISIPTAAPDSAAPVTKAPVSAAPVTKAPASAAPVTKAPASAAPVTKAPVAVAPVTDAPVPTAPVTTAPVATTVAIATPTNVPIISPVAVEPFALRINVGSAERYVDKNGTIWEGDQYFDSNGAVYSLCPMGIAGTESDTLYCKERYFNKWVHKQPFRYEIPVPKNGTYMVKLHFAEIHYKSVGERVFGIWVNGNLAVPSLDIFAEAGYATAHIVPILTSTTNGHITMELIPKKENPKISAIEVIEELNYIPPPTKAPVQKTFATRINVGASESWEDDDGSVWESDKYYNGKGDIYWQCPMSINGTELDGLYCKERYFNKWRYDGPFKYDIPVPENGSYSVKLHFAETTLNGEGLRVFGIKVGTKVVRKELDIYKEVGFATALMIPIDTLTTNGVVSIELTPIKENPKICAIEVIKSVDTAPAPVQALKNQLFATRISAGAADNWEDDKGVVWESDKYYGDKGDVHWLCPMSINGTDLDELYCKERYFNKWRYNGPFKYDIPVPKNGTYSVKLHFSETSHQGEGLRVFGVKVGNKVVRKALDIYKEVGYASALVIPIDVITTNEIVSIELIPITENPKICAIEVIESLEIVAPQSMVVPSFEYRINAGTTDSWEDENGVVWEKDDYSGGKGGVYSTCPKLINGTDIDSIYCKERFFNRWTNKAPFRYEIPVPRVGYYKVQLHFAETWYQTRGERIFDVLVGDKVALGSLDIFAEVGFATAFILPITTYTRTGFVTIEFIPKVENPKICAIEIIEAKDFISPPTAAPAAKPFEILINSGAVEDYISRKDKRVWSADKYFIGGGVLVKRHYDIEFTEDDEVFHLERNGEFRYEIPVPKGTYDVYLHFAELHFVAMGSRKFDIAIEKDAHFKNVDIWELAMEKGVGIRKSMSLQHMVVVTDGLLSLEFMDATPKVDMAKLSGIEVRFLSSSVEKANTFPIRINCGSESDYIEEGTGQRWLADRNFFRGNAWSANDSNANPLTKDIVNPIYQTARVGVLRYNIPVPVGTYNVTMHFMEPIVNNTGSRIFHIEFERKWVITFLDVFRLSGGIAKPLVYHKPVNVTDGLLSIYLHGHANVPVISAIEVNRINTPIAKTPVTTVPTRSPIIGSVSVPTTVDTPKQCSIPKLSLNGWSTPKAPYPIHVAEPAGDLIGTDMVLFGGFINDYTTATTATYALDVSTTTTTTNGTTVAAAATWKRMDDMPFTAGITHQAMVVIGMKAYMCGGYVGGSLGMHTDKCFVYDHSVAPGTGKQWSIFPSLPMGGRSGGGMIYDRQLNAIVFTGGSQRAKQGQAVAMDYKETWMYSFSNPTAGWVRQSNIPFYGNHMNSITVIDKTGKDRHYIFGGQVGDYELWGNVATMYEYIASTDQWMERTPMPFPRGHSTFAVRPVGDCTGGFIVAGGRTNTGLTGDITYYNIETDTWQSIGRLPVDIHTNVCVVTKSNVLRCEAGWISNTFSTEIQLEL